MAAKEKSYYDILGVKETASTDEIKKAFKRLARQHHPDAGGDEAKFKEVSEAYETLSDAEKRDQYDTFLKYGAFAAAGGGGRGSGPWGSHSGQQGNWRTVTDYGDMGSWGDIFSRIANGEGAFGTKWDFPNKRAKGTDMQVTLELSFEDAFAGVTKRITVRTADDSTLQLDVKVPAGAVDGGKLRYKGKGGKGSNGGANGDLVVVTRIRPHDVFTRKGADVLMTLPVTIDQAALGASLTVVAPDGSKVKLKLAPGTQEGKVFLVKGKGARKVKEEGYGDLRAKVHVEVPRSLNDAQKAALEAFAEASKLANVELDAAQSADGAAQGTGFAQPAANSEAGAAERQAQ